jgi:hypothetical protein
MSGDLYRWVGWLVDVRLPDGATMEGILLEVAPPWIVVQEDGVRRQVHLGPGVVVTYAFDRVNPYHEGHERAKQRLAAIRAAERRRGWNTE